MENLEKDLLLETLKGFRTDINNLRAETSKGFKDINKKIESNTKFRWKLVFSIIAASGTISTITAYSILYIRFFK